VRYEFIKYPEGHHHVGGELLTKPAVEGKRVGFLMVARGMEETKTACAKLGLNWLDAERIQRSPSNQTTPSEVLIKPASKPGLEESEQPPSPRGLPVEVVDVWAWRVRAGAPKGWVAA
jgi:hypothetical protein